MTNKFLSDVKFFSVRHLNLIFWLGGAFLFLGLFIRITFSVFEGSDFEGIDEFILLSIARMRAPSLHEPMVDLTALGSVTVTTILTLVIVLLLWLKRDGRAALYVILGPVGAGSLGYLVKHFISRPRPSIISPLIEVSGFSYPSGHALASTSLFLLLAFLGSRYFKTNGARLALFAAAALLIVAVGLSRLYLGVHYPSDVVSGTMLGASWAFFLTGIFARKPDGAVQ